MANFLQTFSLIILSSFAFFLFFGKVFTLKKTKMIRKLNGFVCLFSKKERYKKFKISAKLLQHKSISLSNYISDF